MSKPTTFVDKISIYKSEAFQYHNTAISGNQSDQMVVVKIKITYFYNCFEDKRTSGVNSKVYPGIYDEFIYNNSVDVTAGGVLSPHAQHFIADMHYQCYGHIYKLTVNIFFLNTKVFLIYIRSP